MISCWAFYPKKGQVIVPIPPFFTFSKTRNVLTLQTWTTVDVVWRKVWGFWVRQISQLRQGPRWSTYRVSCKPTVSRASPVLCPSPWARTQIPGMIPKEWYRMTTSECFSMMYVIGYFHFIHTYKETYVRVCIHPFIQTGIHPCKHTSIAHTHTFSLGLNGHTHLEQWLSHAQFRDPMAKQFTSCFQS